MCLREAGHVSETSSDRYHTVQHQRLTKISSVHINNGKWEEILVVQNKCQGNSHESKRACGKKRENEKLGCAALTRSGDSHVATSSHPRLRWKQKDQIFIMAVKTENVLCLQLCYLLPHSIHFETSEKVKNQIFHITNMYNIFWPVFLPFHYCTSILSHTLIYIAFKLPKSYLHIFGKTLINVNST